MTKLVNDMPDQEIHNGFRRDIEKLDGKMDVLLKKFDEMITQETGTRKAVEFQNGRVRKLEDRWERLMWGSIIALGGIVISLVVYIYINNTQNQAIAIQQALQGLEIQIAK